jgi:hypothetical protein
MQEWSVYLGKGACFHHPVVREVHQTRSRCTLDRSVNGAPERRKFSDLDSFQGDAIDVMS